MDLSGTPTLAHTDNKGEVAHLGDVPSLAFILQATLNTVMYC